MNIIWSFTILITMSTMKHFCKCDQLQINRQLSDKVGGRFQRTVDSFKNPWMNETFCSNLNAECSGGGGNGGDGSGKSCTQCTCGTDDGGGSNGVGGTQKTFVSYVNGCMGTQKTLTTLSGQNCWQPKPDETNNNQERGLFHANLSPKDCTEFLSSEQYVPVGNCQFTKVLLYDPLKLEFVKDDNFGKLYDLKIESLTKVSGPNDFAYCFKCVSNKYCDLGSLNGKIVKVMFHCPPQDEKVNCVFFKRKGIDIIDGSVIKTITTTTKTTTTNPLGKEDQEKKKKSNQTVLIVLIVVLLIVIILVVLGFILLKRKRLRKQTQCGHLMNERETELTEQKVTRNENTYASAYAVIPEKSGNQEQESENMYYCPATETLHQNATAGTSSKQSGAAGNIYEDTDNLTNYASVQEQYPTQSTNAAKQPKTSLLSPPPTTATKTESNKSDNKPGDPNRYQVIPKGTFERENGYTKIQKQKNDSPAIAQQHQQSQKNDLYGCDEPVKQFEVKPPGASSSSGILKLNSKDNSVTGYEEVGATINSGLDDNGGTRREYDEVGSVLD